ncbi:MAG: dihydroorotate dehydrogenase, partial [Bacteroidetes bacterium]|nr:dihydroorotate dehydrogenase [Bacteroidota bacterium]
MVTNTIISTPFLGLNLVSPIILLSGCVGFGNEYTRLEGFSNKDIGGAVLKRTNPEPRLGKKPHRVIENASGKLNSIGVQKPGGTEVVGKILPSL